MPKTEFRLTTILLASALLFGGCNVLKTFQGPDDKGIVAQIQAALFQDPVLKTRDVRVTSDKGIVTLAGTVASDTEKLAAERLASQATGVKQVSDQLAVSAPAAQAQAETLAEAPPAAPAAAEAPTPPRASAHTRRPPATTAPAAARAETASATAAPPAPAPRPADAARPPAPVEVTVPSGTVVTVRMIDGIDSQRNRSGEEFAASVESPVVVGDRVVIPKGSDARIRLVEAKSAGHMTGQSELEVELVSLTANGKTYNVESSVNETRGASRGKRSAEVVGGGAGLGALIGAIAGKGKGAAIGAAVGAGAGTVVQATTHGQQVKVPSEAKLDFTLKTPITVTY